MSKELREKLVEIDEICERLDYIIRREIDLAEKKYLLEKILRIRQILMEIEFNQL